MGDVEPAAFASCVTWQTGCRLVGAIIIPHKERAVKDLRRRPPQVIPIDVGVLMPVPRSSFWHVPADPMQTPLALHGVRPRCRVPKHWITLFPGKI